MNELVERVEEAIVELHYKSRLDDGVEPTCREIARAAIAAMREPTEAMRDAGYMSAIQYCDADANDAGLIWQAMIDEALGAM